MNEKDIEEMTDDQARKIGDKILKVLNSNFRTPEDDAADHARQTLAVMAAYLNQMASMLGVKDVKPGTDKQATAIITEIDNLKRHAHGLQTQLDTVLALSKTAAFNLGLSRKNAHDWEEAADAARNDLEQVACDLGVGDDIGMGRSTIDVVRQAVRLALVDKRHAEMRLQAVANVLGVAPDAAAMTDEIHRLKTHLQTIASAIGTGPEVQLIINEIHRRERNSDAMTDENTRLSIFASKALKSLQLGPMEAETQAEILEIAARDIDVNCKRVARGETENRVPMSGIERDVEDLKQRVADLERHSPVTF